MIEIRSVYDIYDCQSLGLYDTELDIWVLDPICYHISRCIGDYRIVQLLEERLFGIVSLNGDWIVEPIYDHIGLNLDIDLLCHTWAVQYKKKWYAVCYFKNNTFVYRIFNKKLKL